MGKQNIQAKDDVNAKSEYCVIKLSFLFVFVVVVVVFLHQLSLNEGFSLNHYIQPFFCTILQIPAQGPEEMCSSLEHQNPSKTSEKMGYFDRVTVSVYIL